MRKRLRKKKAKAKFPRLDPTRKLDWEDKHILAFSAKSNYEATYFFVKLVEHTVASEGFDRAEAEPMELGRLRMVAINGLGNPNVDTDKTMHFVYQRYIIPQCKRLGLALDNADGWGTPKQRIIVPDLGAGIGSQASWTGKPSRSILTE
jgi:hypothetical protein